jgi:hypothetical protein
VYIAAIGKKSMLVAEWCRLYNIDRDKVISSIKQGTPPAIAVIAAVLRKRVWIAHQGGKVDQGKYAQCLLRAKKINIRLNRTLNHDIGNYLDLLLTELRN